MAKLMMFRPWKMLLILILFIICSGCAVYYIPQPYPIKPEMIPDFSVSHAVTIVNAQTDKTFKAPKCPDRLIMGNLRKWTGTAVEVLKTELKKNDITVSEDAPKVLKLTVTKVYMFCGTWNARCILYLRVETGDGYTKEFEGNNSSPEGYKGAGPLAVTKAVAAMLNNDKILGYLRK